MKSFTKVTAVAALVLSLASVGVTNARAAGWPVAAGVAGGFVAGAVITRAVADCPAPGYYVYPQRVFVAPACAPAPVVVAPAPICYAPVPAVYPAYCPPLRVVPFPARGRYLRRW
jgi:hypothetical protein